MKAFLRRLFRIEPEILFEPPKLETEYDRWEKRLNDKAAEHFKKYGTGHMEYVLSDWESGMLAESHPGPDPGPRSVDIYRSMWGDIVLVRQKKKLGKLKFSSSSPSSSPLPE